MDAVILAAGLGTRLRPYTEKTPKPLLAIRGRSILDWTLGALPEDVTRLIVVVHYLAEQIEQYLETQQHVRSWEVVHQTNPQGTGDAVRSCASLIQSQKFMVLNGDDLYASADLAALAKVPAGLLVHPVDTPRQFGIAFPRSDGTLERLEEKPDLTGRHLANTGAYVFPKFVFEIELTRSSRNEYEITEYVSKLAQRTPVQVVNASFWLPIGTAEVWHKAQDMLLESLIGASPP